MSKTIKIGVSVDLLGTLIDVHNGSGVQHTRAFHHFLEHYYNLRATRDLPALDPREYDKRFLAAYRVVAHRDRKNWLACIQSGMPEEEVNTKFSVLDPSVSHSSEGSNSTSKAVDKEQSTGGLSHGLALEESVSSAPVVSKRENEYIVNKVLEENAVYSKEDTLLKTASALEKLDPLGKEMPVGFCSAFSQKLFWFRVIDLMMSTDDAKKAAEIAFRLKKQKIMDSTDSGTDRTSEERLSSAALARYSQSDNINWTMYWTYAHDLFGTAGPYSWLPDAQNTISNLYVVRELVDVLFGDESEPTNVAGDKSAGSSTGIKDRRELAYTRLTELLGDGLPSFETFVQQQERRHVSIRIAPLTVVSNCDSRLEQSLVSLLQHPEQQARERTRHIQQYLKGIVPESSACADLLYFPFFTLDVVGRAKPSPRGILSAARAVGVLDNSSSTFKDDVSGGAVGSCETQRYWIHVGDAPEDQEAARRAGCECLSCTRANGISWSELANSIKRIIIESTR